MCSKRDIYVNKAIEKHGDKYDYSLVKNINKRIDVVSIICPIHGEFTQSLHKHICGDGCRPCGFLLTGSKKTEKARNDFIEKANKIHKNKYDYSLVTYENAKKDVIIICKRHSQFKQTPNCHLNGYGCRLCANDKISERVFIPWEVQLKKFIEIHNDKYDYSLVEYMGVDENITVICPKHGEFCIKASSHKIRGCQKCSKENIIYKNKCTQKEIIDKFISIWGNTYDYSLTKYINSYTKVKIICKVHGIFEQLHSNHFRYGCSKCGKNSEYNELLKKKCSENFVQRANIIHNNRYTYANSVYLNSVTKLLVTCKIHGDFQITPNNHLRGKNCSNCSKIVCGDFHRKPLSDYIKKFNLLFGDKYDYSTVDWKGGSKYITLTCKKHGEFNILPYVHIKGKDCPKCSNHYSKISIEWLQYLQIKYNIFIQHAGNLGEFNIPTTRLKADGYCKKTNTIYEFLGDFWHGNPDVFDLLELNKRTNTTYLELYEDTINKKEKIINLGYNYIEIWENDWKKFINIVKNVQRIWRYYY
jgi:hypothetical protein